jgi:hydrogenase-4 component F
MVYRFVPLTEISLNHSFLFAILAGFGLATLIVAAVFVVVQRDYKRLLAYSSMEHSALMLLGVAFGGPLGLFGALWQLMTHAVIKSAMFFGAGNVLIHYETNEMDEVKGILRRMPVTGWLWLLCVAAIVGAPPFALFGSDLGILGAAFLRNHWALGGITALLLAMIYITLFYYFVRMIYGHSEAETDANHSDASPWSVIPMFVLVTMALIFGLAIPDGLLHLLKNAAAILQ